MQTSHSSLQSRAAGFIGNILEHYDAALFGFLAPFLAPLFFASYDPITALILTYGIMPLGVLSRPLGALFFGYIGDRYGRRQALFFSLSGMALATVAMGCLPVYEEVGMWAPILLTIGRMLQSFCAAGETTGAAIFILENTLTKKRALQSGLYGASTLAGMLVAALLVSLFGFKEGASGWRLLFWLGGICGFIGLFIRLKVQSETDDFQKINKRPLNLFFHLKAHKTAFMLLTLAAGFSYTTYALPFTLMNGYIPMVTDFSKADAMKYNSVLLVIDMCLLPFFGWLANRFGEQKVMLAGALAACAGALPMFYMLENSSLMTILAIRLYIVICGVAFAAPYYAWSMQLIPPECRYTLLSLASAIGSQLIGSSSSAICLWLYQQMDWVFAPGFYLMVVAILGTFAVMAAPRNKRLA